MPTEERGSIGSVKPSGWHLVKYDIVDGAYLYNRCHLIAYRLAGENANERNLVTGTRFMNVRGMVPFEDRVASYVDRSPDEQPNSASDAANAPAATSAPHFLIFMFLPFPLHPLFSNTISMMQSHYYTAPDALYQRSRRQEKG